MRWNRAHHIRPHSIDSSRCFNSGFRSCGGSARYQFPGNRQKPALNVIPALVVPNSLDRIPEIIANHLHRTTASAGSRRMQRRIACKGHARTGLQVTCGAEAGLALNAVTVLLTRSFRCRLNFSMNVTGLPNPGSISLHCERNTSRRDPVCPVLPLSPKLRLSFGFLFYLHDALPTRKSTAVPRSYCSTAIWTPDKPRIDLRVQLFDWRNRDA